MSKIRRGIEFDLAVIQELREEIQWIEGPMAQSPGPGGKEGEQELRAEVARIRAIEEMIRIFIRKIEVECRKMRAELDRRRTYRWGKGVVYVEKEENKEMEEKTMEERKPQAVAQTGQFVPGTEEKTPEDVAIPRLRLLQSTSTEVEEGTSKAGDIRHSLSGEEFEKVEFISLNLRKTRIHFDPDNIKGAPICFAPDAKQSRGGSKCLEDCPFDDAHLWTGNEAPRCDLVLSFPCLLLKGGKLEGDFASVNLAKSSTAASQKLIYLRAKSGKPYWYFVYELFTRQEKFTKGTAYVFDIQQVRESKPQERKAAEEIFKSDRQKPVTEEDVSREDAF